MKRPGAVTGYTILVVVGIIITAVSSLLVLLNPLGRMGLPEFAYEGAILSLILLIPTIIFVYLFFTMKKSSLIWFYISFGLSLVINLIAGKWLTAILVLVVGWIVWDYISHKKVDGELVFS